jgi:hypothetical protein
MTSRRFIRQCLVGTLLALCASLPTQANEVDEDEVGAWYMYFWSTTFGDSRWGLQGDAQYRNWDLLGDMEQLLLRGGLTFRPRSANVLFTLGYANITTGEPGSRSQNVNEDRIYQEMLLPHKVGPRVYLRHRFRYEQRWVDNQDFRTRFRYALFADIPLNREDLKRGAVYLALYNEVFINGEQNIGNNRRVETFDRNRLYGAIGYSLRDNLRTQFGYMSQHTDDFTKGQLQLSLHHSF